MKLILQHSTLEQSQDFEEQSFYIGDAALIMEILRSKMYSNPIRTIVQEVGSNCRDAHREVGTPEVPFVVKLPTRHSPTVEWRDFGPGISPKRIVGIVLGYGLSTKREDDVQTGGYGLGFKSPFSYVDSFCVETVTLDAHFKGQENVLVKRCYVAVIDPSRKGKVSKLSEEVTTEPRGTKVIVACKPGDEEKFTEQVRNIYHHWERNGEHRPTVNGGPNFKWREDKVDHGGANWDTVATTYNSDNGSITAIVDGIPYTVKRSELGDTDAIDGMYYLHTRIHFKTGEVPLTAPREELDYSAPATIEKLRNAILGVKAELKKIYAAKVNGCKTFWGANVVWGKVAGAYTKAVGPVDWNGLVIHGKNLRICGEPFLTAWMCRPNSRKKLDYIEYTDPSPLIVFDDTGLMRPSESRLRTLHRQYFGRHILVCQWDETSWLELGSAGDIKKRLAEVKAIHHPELWGAIKMSEVVADVIPRTKEYVKRPMLPVRRFNPDVSSTAYTENWVPVPTQNASGEYCTVEKGDGLYVVMVNKEPHMQMPNGTSKYLTREQLKTLARFAKGHIYGIQQKYAHRIGDGWTDLGAALRKQMARILKEKNVVASDSNDRVYAKLSVGVADILGKRGDAQLKEWVKQSDAHSSAHCLYGAIEAVADIIGMSAELDNAVKDFASKSRLKALLAENLKRHPLLVFITGKSQDKDLEKALVDYVNR